MLLFIFIYGDFSKKNFFLDKQPIRFDKRYNYISKNWQNAKTTENQHYNKGDLNHQKEKMNDIRLCIDKLKKEKY